MNTELILSWGRNVQLIEKLNNNLEWETVEVPDELTVKMVDEIGEDLGSRGKIEELFDFLNAVSPKLVIFDWDGVNFIGGSAGKEYLNQRSKASFDGIEDKMDVSVFHFLVRLAEEYVNEDYLEELDKLLREMFNEKLYTLEDLEDELELHRVSEGMTVEEFLKELDEW